MAENQTVLELYNSSDLMQDRAIQIAGSLIYSFLTLIGIVGNILVITVVFRVRGMLTPTNCYLVSLAASDCLFFVATSPREIAALHLPGIYFFGAFGCAVLSFLPYLAINASSLSITFFTIERYIGICHPMRAKYICTVKRARFIICWIWFFSVAWNSPWLFLAQLKPINDIVDFPNASMCGFGVDRTHWTYKMIYASDFVMFYLLPLLLYLVLYGRITWILMRGSSYMSGRKERHRKGHLSQENSTVETNFCETPRNKALSLQPCSKISNASSSDDKGTEMAQVHQRSISHSQPNGNQETPLLERVSPREFGKVAIALAVRAPLPARTTIGNCANRESFVTGGAQMKGKIQVIKMLVVIVCVFATCWLPYRAMVLYNSFSNHHWAPEWYVFVAKILLYINCAINPVLYNLMSKKFRDAFRELPYTFCGSRRQQMTFRRYASFRHSEATDISANSMRRPLRIADSVASDNQEPTTSQVRRFRTARQQGAMRVSTLLPEDKKYEFEKPQRIFRELSCKV